MPGKLLRYLFDRYSEDIYGFYEDKKALYEDILTDIGKYDCGILNPVIRSPLQRMKEQYDELKRYNTAVLEDYHGMEEEYNKMSDFISYHRLFELYHEYHNHREKPSAVENEELPFI